MRVRIIKTGSIPAKVNFLKENFNLKLKIFLDGEIFF